MDIYYQPAGVAILVKLRWRLRACRGSALIAREGPSVGLHQRYPTGTKNIHRGREASILLHRFRQRPNCVRLANFRRVPTAQYLLPR